MVHRRSGGVGPRRGLPGPPAGPRGRYDTKLPPLAGPARDLAGPSRDKSGDVSLEPSYPRTDQGLGQGLILAYGANGKPRLRMESP